MTIFLSKTAASLLAGSQQRELDLGLRHGKVTYVTSAVFMAGLLEYGHSTHTCPSGLFSWCAGTPQRFPILWFAAACHYNRMVSFSQSYFRPHPVSGLPFFAWQPVLSDWSSQSKPLKVLAIAVTVERTPRVFSPSRFPPL